MTEAKRYQYEVGTVRWLYATASTVKKHKQTEGWKSTVHEMSYHPITCDPLSTIQTWIKEVYVGVPQPERERPVTQHREYRAW